jgi:ribulose-bisphosphate carboxylase large chain
VAWLTATYLIASEPENIEARAAALALEQSVECPLAAIGDQRVLDEIVAQVASIEPESDGRYCVRVRIATQTIGDNTAQLINMIFGNCSLWENVEFVDVDLPDSLLKKFPGPRHGIEGIRRLVDASERALTSTATKPQGLPISELARMCHTFALGGIDIIKDDHGIADQDYSPFEERVRACFAAIETASDEIGKRVLYAPNLIGSPRKLRDRARFVRDLGVRVVLVSPMVIGLPTFRDLVDEFPELAYLAHPSFGGAGRIAPRLLFGRIFRLLGADAVIFVNYGGRFAYSREQSLSIAGALREPWGILKPAIPVPAGGMTLERVDELLCDYGRDTMLLIGGNLLIGRERLLERTREFVEKVHGYGQKGRRTDPAAVG